MGTESRQPLRLTPQTVIALLIIFFGLVKTADNLGWVHAESVLRLWPLGLVAIGARVYSRAEDQSNRIMGGVIAGLGIFLAIGPLFGVRAGVFDLWPLVLVAAGATIILRARQDQRETPGPTNDQHVSGDQHVSAMAFWAGIKRKVTSRTFRRAELTSVMGGIELDLRGASVVDGEAVVDVFVMMGGLEIRVPADWSVSNQVAVIMGGIEDKSQNLPASPSRLILRGFVVMGGVEVKN